MGRAGRHAKIPAPRFQSVAARTAAKMTARVMFRGLTIPLPRVSATAVPRNQAPANSKTAMRRRALRGSRAR